MARQCSIERRPGFLGRTVSAQAARPHGTLGRALGHLWVHETAAINDCAIELLDLSPGDTALEIGCGPGRALAELARRGVQVTGVDPSPVMVAQAQRRNRSAIGSGRVRLLNGAIGSLPTEPVDAVLAVHTVYFWPDLVAGLREIRAVLVPGGRVGIGFRPAERGRPRRLDPTVYRIPTTTQVTQALYAAGFLDLAVHDISPAAVVVGRTPDAVVRDHAGAADTSVVWSSEETRPQ
jgi:SAM-dependent methyltransferase